MNRHFTTSRGTELPLLNLRGKDYLEVKYRLVWFREEHPSWSIETNFVSIADKSACAKAIVKDEDGRVIATSHKAETASGFPDFLEKAETGAIGRALALVGYGTQFCADELDEGERIVDAPVTRREISLGKAQQPAAISATSTELKPGTATQSETERGYHFETYQIGFGKYRGRRLVDIPKKDIENYLVWLNKEAAKKNSALSVEAAILSQMAKLYFEQLDKDLAETEVEDLKQNVAHDQEIETTEDEEEEVFKRAS